MLEQYEKAGYTPEQVARIAEADTGVERLRILDEIEKEVTGVTDVEARAEILPAEAPGVEAEAAAVEPTAPPEVHPQQPSADLLAERIKRPGQVIAVDAPTEQVEGTQAAADALGFKEVVWVENQSDMPFSASTTDGILYVEKNASRPGITAALHEAIEVVAQESPEDFQVLVDLVSETAKEQGKSEQLARLGQAMAQLDQEQTAELTVQLLQEFATDETFWQELSTKAQSDPKAASTLTRIIEKIIKFIDDFAAKMGGNERLQSYFEANDMALVRTSLVDVLQRTREQAEIEAQPPTEARAVPEAPAAPEAVVEPPAAPVEAPAASDLPEATQKRIAEPFKKGKKLWRGISSRPSDPGDFGQGTYHTTTKVRAKQYGELTQQTVTLQNPLVLTDEAAYDLSTQYGTISGVAGKDGAGPMDQRALRAAEMTKALQAQGYDGLIAVRKDGQNEIVVFGTSGSGPPCHKRDCQPDRRHELQGTEEPCPCHQESGRQKHLCGSWHQPPQGRDPGCLASGPESAP
jgi:hypothetical protein